MAGEFAMAAVERFEERNQLAADRDALIAYLQVCVRGADWHAVSDAANDLRVLEARMGKR